MKIILVVICVLLLVFLLLYSCLKPEIKKGGYASSDWLISPVDDTQLGVDVLIANAKKELMKFFSDYEDDDLNGINENCKKIINLIKDEKLNQLILNNTYEYDKIENAYSALCEAQGFTQAAFKEMNLEEKEAKANELFGEPNVPLLNAIGLYSRYRSKKCHAVLKIIAYDYTEEELEQICDLNKLIELKLKDKNIIEFPDECKHVVGMRLIQLLPVMNNESEKLFKYSISNNKFIFEKFYYLTSVIIELNVNEIIKDPITYISNFVLSTKQCANLPQAIEGKITFEKCFVDEKPNIKTEAHEFNFFDIIGRFQIKCKTVDIDITNDVIEYVKKTFVLLQQLLLKNIEYVDFVSFIGQMSRTTEPDKNTGLQHRLTQIFKLKKFVLNEPGSQTNGNQEQLVESIDEDQEVEPIDEEVEPMNENKNEKYLHFIKESLSNELNTFKHDFEENFVLNHPYFSDEETSTFCEKCNEVKENPYMINVENEHELIYSKSLYMNSCSKEKIIFDILGKHIRDWYDSAAFKNELRYYTIQVNGNITNHERSNGNFDVADIYPAIKVEMMIVFLCLQYLREELTERLDIYIAVYVLYVQLFNSYCACKMQKEWNTSIKNEYVYIRENLNVQSSPVEILNMFKDLNFLKHEFEKNIDDCTPEQLSAHGENIIKITQKNVEKYIDKLLYKLILIEANFDITQAIPNSLSDFDKISTYKGKIVFMQNLVKFDDTTYHSDETSISSTLLSQDVIEIYEKYMQESSIMLKKIEKIRYLIKISQNIMAKIKIFEVNDMKVKSFLT